MAWHGIQGTAGESSGFRSPSWIGQRLSCKALGIRRRWKELAEITVLTRADCKAWVGHCQQTKRPPCGRQGTKGSASIRMYHDNHPKAGLSGRKRVGLSVLRTDSEPCEVLVWHERDSGDKLRADRSTQISSACPLYRPTLLLPHTTQTNYNNYIRTKTFQANNAFSTAGSYFDYQAQHHQPHPQPQIV